MKTKPNGGYHIHVPVTSSDGDLEGIAVGTKVFAKKKRKDGEKMSKKPTDFENKSLVPNIENKTIPEDEQFQNEVPEIDETDD